MPLLTGKQKRYLRSLAHHVSPLVQVGKSGITGNLVEQVDLQLEAHELIKIAVLETSPISRDDVAVALCEETGADWVQSIGRLLVLYRKSVNHPRIEVPQA